jgi:hypothetical protein
VLVAATRHSSGAPPPTPEDVAVWVMLLPPDRRTEYLVRLARYEPGLSRLLVKELRELSQLSQNGQDKSSAARPTDEHVTYATLLAESKAMRAQLEHEQREQERLARQRQLQQMHDHQDEYWHHVDVAMARGSGAGYDEAARLLSELREVADRFQEPQQFHERFRAWVRPHLRRPAFVKRLQDRQFPLPDA